MQFDQQANARKDLPDIHALNPWMSPDWHLLGQFWLHVTPDGTESHYDEPPELPALWVGAFADRRVPKTVNSLFELTVTRNITPIDGEWPEDAINVRPRGYRWSWAYTDWEANSTWWFRSGSYHTGSQ